MKTIAIVAGGNPPNVKISADFIIGVDRGALWLIDHGISPDVSLGDFDSVDRAEKQLIQSKSKRFQEFSPKKDKTDLELAVDEVIRQKSKEALLYGVLGSRFDHALAAISMLLKLESHNILGQIVDNSQKINIVRHKMRITKDARYQYVSLVPYEIHATVTITGFLYPLTNHALDYHSTLGLSNQIVGSAAEVIVHTGSVLVIQSRD